MKKTLLLSALVVTATAFAGTTGKFTIDSKHNAESMSKKALSEKVKKQMSYYEFLSVKSEIKGAGEVTLGESGVTLGGDVKISKGKTPMDIVAELKAKESKPLFEAVDAAPEAEKAAKLNEAYKDVIKKMETKIAETEGVYVKELNAFVKYDFTTGVEGLDAYIKGNVKAEKIMDFQNDVEVMGEGQVSYKKDDMTYTLNSKTKSKLVEVDVTSDHEVKVEGKYDKVEDILVSAKLHHGYIRNSEKDPRPNEPLYLLTDAKGTVNVMDGLKIGAHNKFDMLFNGENKDGDSFTDGMGAIEIDKFIIFNKDFSFVNKGDLAEMFKLYATYDKNNVEATGAGIVEYIKVNNKDVKLIAKDFNFGVKLDGKYKAIENVELGGSLLLAGKTKLANKEANKDAKNETSGLVRLGVNAKYTAKVNDKLTVTPGVEAKFNIEDIKASKTDDVTKKTTKYSPSLNLSVIPTVGVEFKATDSVTLTASGKATVTANRDSETVKPDTTAKNKFKYMSTALEAKLGLKYTW